MMDVEDVVVSHPGTHHSYMTALAMQEAGRLESYITSFFFRTETLWGKALGNVPLLRRQMLKRYNSDLDQKKIRCVPQYELLEKSLDRTIFRRQTDNRRVYWRDRAFDRRVAQRYVTNCTRVLIGYPNACLRSFQSVKKKGGKAILDLPIGYFRKATSIFEEEKRLHPEFADSITYSSFDHTYTRRVDEEIALADFILVPSHFVRDSLVEFGIQEAKIVELPYGSWLAPVEETDISFPDKGTPVRIVYFGQISQRKGIRYLLEAIRLLRMDGIDVKATFVGGLFGSCSWMDEYTDCFTYLGMAPRSELSSILLNHDVFVLPTLFEGSAYVVPEALSHGLPVITTEHAGAESIQHGQNGYIVPIRDSQQIASYLSKLSNDASLLHGLKLAALRSSRDVTWDHYRNRLNAWFRSLG